MKNYISIACDISSWLKSYLIKNNLKTFVIGVSGGIDSAVVSTLCAKTTMPVIVLNIPILSTEHNTNLSEKHCKWLSSSFSNVKYIKVDLSDTYNEFFNLIKKELNIDNKLANANTKSRLRMVALYHLATEHSGLVVGT
jgi:NAD+ synthase